MAAPPLNFFPRLWSCARFELRGSQASQKGYPHVCCLCQYERTFQLFYRNLQPDSQSVLRRHFIPLIDGICNEQEQRRQECPQTGRWRPEEWENNLTFGMEALLATEGALRFYIQYSKKQEISLWQTFWENLPEEEQWKVRIATYNAGPACIGDAIVASGGQARTWQELENYIDMSGCGSALTEVQRVWHYLQGGP